MNRLPVLLLALMVATPAVAHEGHGAPGLLHGFSDEHGLALLAVIGILAVALWLRAPVLRLIARHRSRR